MNLLSASDSVREQGTRSPIEVLIIIFLIVIFPVIKSSRVDTSSGLIPIDDERFPCGSESMVRTL